MATIPFETLERLKAGEPVPLPSEEEWAEMLARTAHPGRVCEIDEATYQHFRWAQISRWSAPTGEWAFADGDDPLRLFWKAGGRFYCRQLTPKESATLRPPAPSTRKGTVKNTGGGPKRPRRQRR
jgi:hypothetical protein